GRMRAAASRWRERYPGRPRTYLARRLERVFGRVEPAQLAEEPERVVGPQRRVPSPRVDVPALTAAPRPDRASHALLDRLVPRVLRAAQRLDRGGACAVELVEGLADVARLRLRHQHHRRVPEARVRP